MNIDEIRIICDTISKLGDDGKSALIWYCVLQCVGPMLAFLFGLVIVAAGSWLIYRIHIKPTDLEEIAQRNERHAACMKAIAEGRSIAVEKPSVDLVRRIVTRWRSHYAKSGVDSDAALRLTERDAEEGRL